MKKDKSTKKQTPKKKLFYQQWWVWAVAAVLALAVVFAFQASNRGQFMGYVERGDHVRANEYYNKNIAGSVEKESKTRVELDNYISALVEKYNDGDLDYMTVKSRLDTIAKLDVTSSSLQDGYDNLETLKNSKSAFENAKEKAEQNDLAGAIADYGKVVSMDRNYDTAKDERAKLAAVYKEAVLNDAESLADEKKWDEAIATLGKAKNLMKDDADIQDRIDEYKSNKPMLLYDMAYQQGGKADGAFKKDSPTGMSGTKYEKSYTLMGWLSLKFYTSDYGPYKTSNYRIFKNDGFKSFKGTIDIYSRTQKTNKDPFVLKVYGDGNEIYSKTTNNSDDPEDFDIDISAYKEIGIEFYGLSNAQYTTDVGRMTIILGNARFEK